MNKKIVKCKNNRKRNKEISISEIIDQRIIIEKIDMIPNSEFNFYYVISCIISTVEFKECAIAGRSSLIPKSKDIRFDITVSKKIYDDIMDKYLRVNKKTRRKK